jgi:thiaminase
MASSEWSLTQQLLAIDEKRYAAATQSPFLLRAAQGQLPKYILSRWLANDRLYIHEYIKATAALLKSVDLPRTADSEASAKAIETRLVDWLIEALVNVRREERFFLEVAESYGLEIRLPEVDGKVPDDAKLEGLLKFEKLFDLKIGVSELPWLEGAVLLWGTEKCYLDAWSWAKSNISESKDSAIDTFSGDQDGGALRMKFIPNWSSKEFTDFVDQLAQIIDQGVNDHLSGLGKQGWQKDNDRKERLGHRASEVWSILLDAEASFWPNVESGEC